MATATKEELTERAQLVRIHEANCAIDFPTPDEIKFRFAIMKKLAQALGLRELQLATITGPTAPQPQRPAGQGGRR